MKEYMQNGKDSKRLCSHKWSQAEMRARTSIILIVSDSYAGVRFKRVTGRNLHKDKTQV